MTTLSLSTERPAYQYIRVCFGSETGEPWMTLYEVDAEGWVHRHVQMHAEGCRFAPEDVLMCSPVNAPSMLTHPSAEPIDGAMFEMLWGELREERTFLSRVPDLETTWEGWMRRGDTDCHLLWIPGEKAPSGWSRVPGFASLFVEGTAKDARRLCGPIFTEAPIRWSGLAAIAA